jgi:hypothetical protein
VTWASGSDVVALTGHPADDELLAQAQSLIELVIGRTEDTATAEITARDLDWLRRATAYQAVWMAGQPDLYTRLDVTQLAQDGMAATFRDGALVLSPLAQSALKRLSWGQGGTRSVTVEPFAPMVQTRTRWRPL